MKNMRHVRLIQIERDWGLEAVWDQRKKVCRMRIPTFLRIRFHSLISERYRMLCIVQKLVRLSRIHFVDQRQIKERRTSSHRYNELAK